MQARQKLARIFGFVELWGVILTVCLLPIDRFPYLHHIPLRLGGISLFLLLIAAAGRFIQTIVDKRWLDFKRIYFVCFLILLPVVGYAQSIHYAIDRQFAVGATKLLLIVALKAAAFFVLLYSNPALWKVIKNTIYGITAAVVAFGFFQFIFDVLGASPHVTDLQKCCTSNSTYVFPRIHSVALEPLYLANFLIIPFWMLILDFYQNKLARKNRLLVFLFAATTILLILTLARSAILSILIAGLIFALGADRRKGFRKLLPNFSRTIIGILIAVVALIMLSGLASRFIHKTALNGAHSGADGSIALFSKHAVNLDDGSAQTRYSTWPKALRLIKQRPLDGVGAYNSRVRLNLNSYRHGVQDIRLQPLNNDSLGLLVDLGFVGILTFGPLVGAVIVASYRNLKLNWRSPSAAFSLAAIAMFIQSNFFQSILLARVWVVAGIALLGLYASPRRAK